MNNLRGDRCVNVFNPEGRLLQVEYAQQAVMLGSIVIGICGKEFVLLAVNKNSIDELHSDRIAKRISSLDDHMMMTFAGVTADARIMIDRARVECQSHKIMIEDPASVEYISLYIACMQQRYTQTNCRRPFGVSALITGFDNDGTSHLFKTDPSGAYHEWKATTTGHGSETVLKFLEKFYSVDIASDEDLAIKLAIQGMVLVLDEINLEIAVMRRNQPTRVLEVDEVHKHIFEIVNGTAAEETTAKKEN